MTRDELIRAIHHSGHQLVISITGGGSGVIGELLRVPGASQSILEAIVPYSCASQVSWLGGTPDQFVSAPTGRAMAMAAFWRARKLADAAVATEKLVGIGCTASLASDRPKKGDHRAYIAVQTADYTHTYSLLLSKDARTRAAEEDMCCAAILAEIATAVGIAGAPRPEAIAGDHAEVEHHAALAPWRELLLERRSVAGNEAAFGLLASGQPFAVFPGAFNPRHSGHEEMVAIAARRLNLPVAYELSIANVDKPPLDYTELHKRTSAFRDEPLLLTRAPTFAKKSELFPGATFLVGADTIVRIADPKYYGGDQRATDRAIATIASRGCRFLVFGRAAGSNFRTLAELPLPESLRAICDQVPEDDFRADISSTELRKQQTQQQQ
jgi:nicotinic acid mononucleotide adenylyltransferase/nicotinamide mononucleotide (NMN) deamidase PncC